jgi:hypothetical protein
MYKRAFTIPVFEELGCSIRLIGWAPVSLGQPHGQLTEVFAGEHASQRTALPGFERLATHRVPLHLQQGSPKTSLKTSVNSPEFESFVLG